MRRGLLVAAVAVVVGTGAAGPAGAQQASRAEPVSTVFFGDSYTANYGIAPVHGADDIETLFCFRAEENYPAVVARQLDRQGVALDIASDRSCGGALAEHFWTAQTLLDGVPARPPQQEALGAETRLAVGSLGGNTVGFVRVLKQCSQKLRDEAGLLLPAAPVDGDQPAGQCAEYFTTGEGKEWLDSRFERVEWDLEEVFDRIGYFAPDAEVVLVGYPRIVPADAAECQAPAPGQALKPLADVPADALPVFDAIQQRLNDVTRTRATEAGAKFVDLYAVTGDNTACDGAERGIGGLFENSQVKFGEDAVLPWFLHPNTRGRDLQAQHVATAVAGALGT